MKVENVLNCSFASWYPKFRKVTMKSLIIPLPNSFIEYLLADGLVLPDSEDHKPPVFVGRHESESDSDVDWSTADTDVAEAPVFPELDKKIKACIEELGGQVFPKLNWSSPKDATWIGINNSISCTSVSDVYLLLKSSDFIAHDLTEPFKFCTDEESSTENASNTSEHKVPYYLVLRKWVEIDPSTEFRCFVKNNNIIGISQRDHTNYYEHISIQKSDILQDIMSFFKEHIKEKFVESDYTFDIYRKKKDVVRLIDFNPFGEVTDSLLYEWKELLESDETRTHNQFPEFRYMSFNRGVQPSPYMSYGLPQDIVDLSTGEDPYKFLDLLKLKTSLNNEVTSSDEETTQ